MPENNLAIRIKFYTGRKGAFSSDKPSILCDSVFDKQIKLSSYPLQLKESDTIFLYCDGFDNQVEAFQVGKRIQHALLIACLKREIFINIGKDKASICGGPVKQMMMEQHRIQCLEDVHGIQIYNANQKTQFLAGPRYPVKIHLRNCAEDVLTDINNFLSQDIQLTNKDLLALELYNASDFEMTTRTRFLLLMLSIETLIEPGKKSEKAQSLIDELKENVSNRDIDQVEKEVLLTGLSGLKDQSITMRGRNLANKYLNPTNKYSNLNPDEFFSKCYKARSKLVHSGNDEDVKDVIASLEVFVRDLLVSKLLIRSKASRHYLSI